MISFVSSDLLNQNISCGQTLLSPWSYESQTLHTVWMQRNVWNKSGWQTLFGIKKRKKKRDRQTDRQKDRQTETETGRQTGRQADRGRRRATERRRTRQHVKRLTGVTELREGRLRERLRGREKDTAAKRLRQRDKNTERQRHRNKKQKSN